VKHEDKQVGLTPSVNDEPKLAFIHTKTDKETLTVLNGELAGMMVRIAPEIYSPYVTIHSKGRPLLSSTSG